MAFSMIRPRPNFFRSCCRSVAQRHSAHRSYHASTTCHLSRDNKDADVEVSSRTPWSELIASRIGERPSWSEEWKRLGLGAELVEDNGDKSSKEDDNNNNNSHNITHKFVPPNLFFVQLGFGVDQHGDRHADGFATKAAIRAVRNAIEFNSIPGVIDRLPGGRHEMLIHVKLGVPKPNPPPGPGGMDGDSDSDEYTNTNTNANDATSRSLASAIDALEVAKVFPYGKLLPIEIVRGGLEFHSGRVVEELGDDDDVGIVCVACVSIGYNNNNSSNDDNEEDDGSGSSATTGHKTYNTKDGY